MISDLASNPASRVNVVGALTTGLVLCLCVVMLTGCHYYEEYRMMKATADLQDEKAELLRAYRQCLTKYQDDPPKAKELCGPYTQSLREVEIKRQIGR